MQKRNKLNAKKNAYKNTILNILSKYCKQVDKLQKIIIYTKNLTMITCDYVNRQYIEMIMFMVYLR